MPGMPRLTNITTGARGTNNRSSKTSAKAAKPTTIDGTSSQTVSQNGETPAGVPHERHTVSSPFLEDGDLKGPCRTGPRPMPRHHERANEKTAHLRIILHLRVGPVIKRPPQHVQVLAVAVPPLQQNQELRQDHSETRHQRREHVIHLLCSGWTPEFARDKRFLHLTSCFVPSNIYEAAIASLIATQTKHGDGAEQGIHKSVPGAFDSQPSLPFPSPPRSTRQRSKRHHASSRLEPVFPLT